MYLATFIFPDTCSVQTAQVILVISDTEPDSGKITTLRLTFCFKYILLSYGRNKETIRIISITTSLLGCPIYAYIGCPIYIYRVPYNTLPKSLQSEQCVDGEDLK